MMDKIKVLHGPLTLYPKPYIALYYPYITLVLSILILFSIIPLYPTKLPEFLGLCYVVGISLDSGYDFGGP